MACKTLSILWEPDSKVSHPAMSSSRHLTLLHQFTAQQLQQRTYAGPCLYLQAWHPACNGIISLQQEELDCQAVQRELCSISIIHRPSAV